MKAFILSNILEELKSKDQTNLYGLLNQKRAIISSLDKKAGLKKIGKFQKNKKHLLETLKSERFMFYPHNDHLYCLCNPGKNKPNKLNITETINYSTDFQNRNHGIIDPSLLQEKTVTIIGLGSGGSAIAEDLTRAGLTNFILIDFDTVSLSNLCRSIYNLDQIGKKKTQALLEKILKINPCLNVQLYESDALDMDSELMSNIINTSDLIIEATDTIKSKVYINGMAYHHKPVLYPSVYDLGTGGDILFTLPGLPCYECVFQSIMDEIKSVKKGSWDYSSSQAKPMPALISDIKIIVARTVKIALALLSADSENSFIDKITECGCSILFIGNEKDTFVFDRPFQEIWAETQIDPRCTCQTLC